MIGFNLLKQNLKSWYRKEGFLQFMLGNEWNHSLFPDEGRVLLLLCWNLFIFGCVIPIVVILM